MRSRTPLYASFSRLVSVRLGIVAALVLISIINLVPPAAAAQVTSPFITATFAPEDSAFYLRVPLDPTSDQWRQVLRLAAIVADEPSIATADLNDLAELSDEPFGADVFLGGEVGIIGSDTAVNVFAQAVAESGDDGDSLSDMALTESGLTFAITTPQPELLALGLRAAIGQTAREVGTQVERTAVDGVPVMSVSVPVDSGATPLAFARVGDVLLVSGFAVDLTPAIETAQGSRPALSNNANFQKALATVDADRFAFGYLNSVWPESFRRAMVELGAPPSALPPAGPAVAVALWAEDDGIAIDALAFADAPKATGANFPAVSALGGAPEDTLVYLAGQNLYGSGIFQVLNAVAFGASGGSSEEELRQSLAPFSDSLGIDIVGDVLARITGDYALWVQTADANTGVNAVITAGVDDPERVQTAIRQFTYAIQSTFEGDDNVTSLAIGDRGYVFQVETGEPAVDPLSYGVVGSELVLGMGSGPAQLSDSTGSLEASPLYAGTLGTLPPASIAALFVNMDLALPLLSETTGQPIPGMSEQYAPSSVGADEPSGNASNLKFDADPACGEFTDQSAAQAAYDEFAPGSFALDRDFDGTACEDFFSAGDSGTGAVGTPQASVAATPVAAAGGPVEALGFSLYESYELVRIGGRILIESDTDMEP